MYIFIARKDDSVDYCRGCLMASYTSDFYYEHNLNEEQLINIWSEYLYRNMRLSINEAGYEFLVFKYGTKVYDDINACGTYTDFESYENSDEFTYEEMQALLEKREIETSSILKKASEIARNRITEEHKKYKEEQEQIRKAVEDKEKQKRLEQYEKLREEFENA